MWVELMSRWLPIAGLGVTLVGTLDPIGGFPIVLIGCVLTLMGALQRRSRHVRMIRMGVALAAAGAAAMVGLSATGGVGPASGRSTWWLVVLAPYPVGIVLCVIGAVLVLGSNPERDADRG